MTASPALIDRLGSDAAATLSRIAGGTQIVVPANLTSTANNAGRLRRRVGDSLFALLVFHFGGTRVYVPQVEATTRNKRISTGRVSRLTQRGWSAARIARHLGCSERTVYAKRELIRARNGSTMEGITHEG